MVRSLRKGPFFQQQVYNLLVVDSVKKKFLILKNKSLVIIPEFINKSLKVYNGCKFVDLVVTADMVGHKVGEFIFTRKLHVFKKK